MVAGLKLPELLCLLAVAPLAGDRPVAVHHGRDKRTVSRITHAPISVIKPLCSASGMTTPP